MNAGDRIRNQVGVQSWNPIDCLVNDQVGRQARMQVVTQIWERIGLKVWRQTGSQVRKTVEERYRG